MKKMAKKKAPKKEPLLNRMSSVRRVVTSSEINAYENGSYLGRGSIANSSQIGLIQEEYYVNERPAFDFSEIRPIEERYHVDQRGQVFDVVDPSRESSAAPSNCMI